MITSQEILAIHLLEGIGSQTLAKLLGEFGSFKGIVSARSTDLASLTWLPRKYREGFQHDHMLRAADEEMAKAQKAGARILTYIDSDYPARLKTIDSAPMVLYVKGQLPADDKRFLGVVGSRAASRYGLKMAVDIAQGVASNGVVIVSGLAVGIDGAAHEGALEAGGQTIGVLGGGLNRFYPSENRKLAERVTESGAVISEFPMDMDPQAEFFPIRNRIISGLSEAVLVVEAREKSGALITVDFALAQGRDVFAVPGNADSSKSLGTNRLIKEGAHMVMCTADVLEEMGVTGEVPERPVSRIQDLTLNNEELKMLAIMDEVECSIDELIEKSCFPIPDAIRTLTALELKGCVRELPGKNFLKVVS